MKTITTLIITLIWNSWISIGNHLEKYKFSTLKYYTKFSLFFVVFMSFSWADQANSGSGALNPISVVAGTYNQNFDLTINLDGGTADSISVSNPFILNQISVVSINIDGSQIPIINIW